MRGARSTPLMWVGSWVLLNTDEIVVAWHYTN